MSQPSPAHHTDDTALMQLVSKAETRRINNLPYGGEVTAQEAFDFMAAHDAVLVDVRTPPEWQAGTPDLAQLQAECLKISWKTYPDYTLNPAFCEQLAAEVSAKDTPLFFLCRSGGRSLDAALATHAAGYGYCFNITGGFEGVPDSRTQVQGWKAATLPWKQG